MEAELPATPKDAEGKANSALDKTDEFLSGKK
jgi:hypothetical protein